MNIWAGKLGIVYDDSEASRSAVAGKLTPFRAFAYVVAALSHPEYQNTFHEQLRRRFPAVPLVSDLTTFDEMADHGAVLVDAFVREGTALAGAPNVSFPHPGSWVVDKIKDRYDPAHQRVYVNEDGGRGTAQTIEGVTPRAWALEIGKYRVLSDWIKRRVGRTLTTDELDQFADAARACDILAERRTKLEDIPLASLIPSKIDH